MRWVELQSNINFRDIGGYRTNRGPVTRWRTIYRSGSFDRTSDADLAIIYDLGVRSVIDLRTDDERTSAAAWHSSVNVVRLPLANPAPADFSLGSFDPAALYIECVPILAQPLAEVVGVVADPDNLPAVISCNGGKDRTGMMVALLLALLAVDGEAILADYALTDQFSVRDPAGYAAALERVRSNGWDPEVLRTRPSTIATFLDEVENQHGSVAELARRGGATTDDLERLVGNLIEE